MVENFSKNETKYHLIFDYSCDENSLFSQFELQHTEVVNEWIKNQAKFIYQKSQLGKDVELQSNQEIFFKSVRDFLHIQVLNQRWALQIDSKERYQDATSVGYGDLFVVSD